MRIRKRMKTKKLLKRKELKRFDPILKEIFSEALGKIYYLATGKKNKRKN